MPQSIESLFQEFLIFRDNNPEIFNCDPTTFMRRVYFAGFNAGYNAVTQNAVIEVIQYENEMDSFNDKTYDTENQCETQITTQSESIPEYREG